MLLLQSPTNHLQTKPPQQLSNSTSLTHLTQALVQLATLNETLSSELIATKLQHADQEQKLADERLGKRYMRFALDQAEMRAREVERRLGLERNITRELQESRVGEAKCGREHQDEDRGLAGSDPIIPIPLGSAALLPDSLPDTRTRTPARRPMNLRTTPPPLLPTNPIISQPPASPALARTREALARAESNLHELSAETDGLRHGLQQAQWGVLTYSAKCARQRKQLSEVQAANAGLKRENARLREEGRRLRRERRGWEEERDGFRVGRCGGGGGGGGREDDERFGESLGSVMRAGVAGVAEADATVNGGTALSSDYEERRYPGGAREYGRTESECAGDGGLSFEFSSEVAVKA